MYALVVAGRELATVSADVTEEIGGLLEEKPPLHIQVKELQTVDRADGQELDRALAIANGVAASDAPVRILSGLERLTDKDWAALNFLRSRLLGDYALVFVLDRRSLVLLQEQAPDLENLITAATWQLDRQAYALSAQARAQRLEALREWAELTDEQIIQKAESAELPGDPSYAEWLVLLGRGDLIVD